MEYCRNSENSISPLLSSSTWLIMRKTSSSVGSCPMLTMTCFNSVASIVPLPAVFHPYVSHSPRGRGAPGARSAGGHSLRAAVPHATTRGQAHGQSGQGVRLSRIAGVTPRSKGWEGWREGRAYIPLDRITRASALEPSPTPSLFRPPPLPALERLPLGRVSAACP